MSGKDARAAFRASKAAAKANTDANLEIQARDFAQRLTTLLNPTVTDGIRLTPTAGVGFVGVTYEGPSGNELDGQPIPLTVSKAPARLYLDLSYRLRLTPTAC